MRRPTPAEVLRFIAEEEPLERTLRRFPTVSEAELRSLLDAVVEAAASSEERSRPKRVSSDSPGAADHAPRVEARHEVSTHPTLRIYSDGAARGNPGPAGAGAVLVGPDGAVVERLGKYLGRNTNNYAEYMGLILGLRRAHELGATRVEVFADSELLVRQLLGQYKVKAPNLAPLYAEAMALLRRFQEVQIRHIRRELNQEADEMSNRAIDERM